MNLHREERICRFHRWEGLCRLREEDLQQIVHQENEIRQRQTKDDSSEDKISDFF